MHKTGLFMRSLDKISFKILHPALNPKVKYFLQIPEECDRHPGQNFEMRSQLLNLAISPTQIVQ
uniref:Uncharacterized protein n=1 Tax=Romanomermis culicivorax TaxID=13658 RepID=A0A915IVV5_ROMCU